MKKIRLSICFMVFAIYGYFVAIEAKSVPYWKPIDFEKHGTRRLLDDNERKVYYYRAKTSKSLSVKLISIPRIKIKAFAKKDLNSASFILKIDDQYRTFVINKVEDSGKYYLLEDTIINLNSGKHDVEISCDNPNVYFRIFNQEYKTVLPTNMVVISPNNFSDRVLLVKGDESKTYHSGTNENPIEFSLIGKKRVFGFNRTFSYNEEDEVKFIVYIDNELDKIIYPKLEKTGVYYIKESPDVKLSVGSKFFFDVPEGKHDIRIVPSQNMIFRMYIESDDMF